MTGVLTRSDFFNEKIKSLLEIGASDGSFLKLVVGEYPSIKCVAVEPDRNVNDQLKKMVNVSCYTKVDEVVKSGRKFDTICFFHVFEHIVKPLEFLDKLKGLMHNETLLIIEVPSLFDPLLTLYHSESYQNFYFQRQHPYIYSSKSLVRLLEYKKFNTLDIIDFQRYGIENHLNWLVNHEPGGSKLYQSIFCKTNLQYINEIELSGQTDSVIWVGVLGAFENAS